MSDSQRKIDLLLGRFWFLYEDGRPIVDQGGFVLTRAEWEALKAIHDQTYRDLSDEEIAAHNEERAQRLNPSPKRRQP